MLGSFGRPAHSAAGHIHVSSPEKRTACLASYSPAVGIRCLLFTKRSRLSCGLEMIWSGIIGAQSSPLGAFLCRVLQSSNMLFNRGGPP